MTTGGSTMRSVPKLQTFWENISALSDNKSLVQRRFSVSDKVVLAYSGGLDTPVAIKWLKEKYNQDIIALTVDIGNRPDFSIIQQKALKAGAVKTLVKDASVRPVRYYLSTTGWHRFCHE